MKVGGAQAERVLELGSIALNKNTVPGDRSALIPGGMRLGTPALTTRGLMECDMETVASFIDRGVQLAKKIQKQAGSKKMVEFTKVLESQEWPELNALREEVEVFAEKFPLASL